MNHKQLIDKFSCFVEQYKIEKGFPTYKDSLEEILENKIFIKHIDYDNVKSFISESLLEKLLIEYSESNQIKEQYIKKENKDLY